MVLDCLRVVVDVFEVVVDFFEVVVGGCRWFQVVLGGFRSFHVLVTTSVHFRYSLPFLTVLYCEIVQCGYCLPL